MQRSVVSQPSPIRLGAPTGLPPRSLVAGLDERIAEAHRIIDDALAEHLEGHELAATAVLFSGGNDSTVLFHLVRQRVTHAIHANTTIGIEATRQFVRDTSAAFGVPLIEKYAPVAYRDLVLADGFPGPARHWKMYTRLKERCLEAARRDLITTSGHHQRVLFIAGRRRAESKRREDVPEHSRKWSVIWASPLAHWTSQDMAQYRATYAVPVNPVAEVLGMSGECLCGSFAEPGEFEHIAQHFPDVAAEIIELEADAREAGVPEQLCRWGWGAWRHDPEAQPEHVISGPLCSSCDFRWRRPDWKP